MQERVELSHRQINQELLAANLKGPRWWWLLVPALVLVVMGAASAAGYMYNRGLGVTGLNRPIFWGIFIVNFVFWIGISHAGVMLSAILRLSHAEWRRPATRAAELLTVFSLMTAAMFPGIIHPGRPWRIYWTFPFDFSRGIWPDVRSALIWDPSAIFTYLTGSTLFVIIALIPDMAVLRDRTTGVKHVIYRFLSLGWRGTPRQWKLQIVAGILLSALLLPVFVSVHSIVSWDFGMAVSVEGWHATIFAPYFVIGAVLSGVAAVVTMMALMRWAFHWEHYIRPEHFDALGRLLIAIALGWFFFFSLEFMFGLYSLEGPEVSLRQMQMFQMPWGALFITFITTAFFIPITLWQFKRVRRNILLMFLISILVNIGMWLERFLIVVPGLMRKQPLTFVWGGYTPSPVEITLVVASFIFVALMVLLFAKVFPLIPLFDIKEGQVLKDEVQVGRVRVPAVMREE
ncbi:MAG: polysulfide reductase NrfD [Chloroflexi bacterium]|nr:polysulfide reductase NrfD [Chloroflexota bacterium]